MKLRRGVVAIRHLSRLQLKEFVRLKSKTETGLWVCVYADGSPAGFALPKNLKPLHSAR